MNLLVGLVILFCLILAESESPVRSAQVWDKLFAIGLVSFCVPGLALVQSFVVSRRFRNNQLDDRQMEQIVRRLSVCHSAVWLMASLAIIYALRWHEIVRINWGLDHWPLLDEATILFPILFSLIASWAIFYDIRIAAQSSGENRLSGTSLRNRFKFVSVRVQVYLLVILFPVVIAVLLRDFSGQIEAMSQTGQLVTLGIIGFAVAALYPLLLLLVWKNRSIAGNSRTVLTGICEDRGIKVRDIRVWETGSQVINAVVAGVIPGLRFILVSDKLLESFPENELCAVVRHEAAHLKLYHLPIRIAFVLFPLAAIGISGPNAAGLLELTREFFAVSGADSVAGDVALGVAYFLYLLVCLAWLSWNMELEADVHACIEKPDSEESRFSPELGKDMSDALLRLVSYHPNQYEKRTLFHPSVARRLAVLQTLIASPERASKFCRAIARRRHLAILALCVCCLVIASIQLRLA